MNRTLALNAPANALRLKSNFSLLPPPQTHLRKYILLAELRSHGLPIPCRILVTHCLEASNFLDCNDG